MANQVDALRCDRHWRQPTHVEELVSGMIRASSSGWSLASVSGVGLSLAGRWNLSSFPGGLPRVTAHALRHSHTHTKRPKAFEKGGGVRRTSAVRLRLVSHLP